MYKKQFKVVLPREGKDENMPSYHICIQERGLHTQSNQTICYSHVGASRYIIPTNQLHRQDIE
jgi:hypothetical protein